MQIKFNLAILRFLMILYLIISVCPKLFGQDKSVYDREDLLPEFKIFYFHDSLPVKTSADYVVRNYERIFNPINSRDDNVVKSSQTVTWLNVRFEKELERDLTISFLPFYKKITLYYLTSDSTIQKEVLGIHKTFNKKYLSNGLVLDLPSKALPVFFIKFEFLESFKVAGFELKTYSEYFTDSIRTFTIYTVLITLILLIFFLSFIFFFLNKEARYLYYGLYTIFFGVFAASCLHVWSMVPALHIISTATYVYYIPFSLSTIFFSLYILNSIDADKSRGSTRVLYMLLFAKGVSMLVALLDLPFIEEWTNRYFSRIDIFIYFILLFVIARKVIEDPKLLNCWLGFGVLVMFIGQIIHVISGGNLNSIFSFMCFDIIWFGIGLSISYRIAKNDKIRALEDFLQIKNSYNKELESQVELRTGQLKENMLKIDELNHILQINNISLSQNVAALEQERILNKEVSFEEFKLQFPDKETCLQLLVRLKWNGEFICNICGHTKYFQIKKTDPYLRKCAECGKIQSATTNTLFHNVKFPLEKAFYIVFLTSTSKKYTVESLSEIISLRAGTIRNFKKKVEETIEAKKFFKDKNMTWQDLII